MTSNTIRTDLPLPELVRAFKAFDRKERIYLVQTCLGLVSKTLDQTFLNGVSEKLDLCRPLDAGSWWTTDYHFDWMAGALALYYEPNLPIATQSFYNESCADLKLVMGSQEDADLLIVDATRIVILEAKRYGAWKPEQVTRKFRRTEHLRSFVERSAERTGRPKIDMHIMFSSPSAEAPPALKKVWKELGCAGDLPWIPLRGAEENPATWAYVTGRCDEGKNGGKPKPNAGGTHWFIDIDRLP